MPVGGLAPTPGRGLDPPVGPSPIAPMLSPTAAPHRSALLASGWGGPGNPTHPHPPPCSITAPYGPLIP